MLERKRKGWAPGLLSLPTSACFSEEATVMGYTQYVLEGDGNRLELLLQAVAELWLGLHSASGRKSIISFTNSSPCREIKTCFSISLIGID